MTWSTLAARARDELHLHVRFGAIPSSSLDAKALLIESLESSGVKWKIVSLRNAHSAADGKRQACHMHERGKAIDEFDLHAVAR